MRCGHSIHRQCHDALMRTSYKCPICSQSVVNMETQFRNLDRAVESQPMPPQFQDTKAVVSCNDCYAKSLVKYHWLGLKCAICDSYNTVQIRILSDLDVEAPREMIEAPDSNPVQGNSSVADSRTHVIPFSGSTRSRRHSSHIRPIATEANSDSLLSSPYNVPQRMGRSVSPFRTSAFLNDSVVATGPNGDGTESESEDDDDDVDFWGGDAPRSPAFGGVAMNEDDDSDDDSLLSMEDGDEEGDDGDDEDHMELLGHR